jgi:hypothetical protein
MAKHLRSLSTSAPAPSLQVEPIWPKLNLIERRDFIHDADLVIRGVVEKELKIVALTKR